MIKKILSRPYILLSLVMIAVFITDNLLGGALTNIGAVYVRNFDEFLGLFFYPFLHGDYKHLTNNLMPFLFFGWFLSKTMDDADFYLMFFFLSITSAVGIWLFGADNSYHVGASGVVFGMWSLILTLAVKRRGYKDILIGLLVIFAYGWTFIYGLVPTEKISFAGHFWGAFFGIVYGLLLIKYEKKKNKKIKEEK